MNTTRRSRRTDFGARIDAYYWNVVFPAYFRDMLDGLYADQFYRDHPFVKYCQDHQGADT